MQKWICLVFSGFLSGCWMSMASGTKGWYDQRLNEWQAARQNAEVNEQQSLQLKNEARRIRELHRKKNKYQTCEL